MNLIQIQERLKDLPSSPQTMQALMAYANGANPQVPPYLALGELNRRKQMMEKSQAEQMQAQAQGAQGTVKDQVEQQAGVMALQQGQQQQAMQNAVRMGAMAPAGIPAGIPQPQPQTVQAAGGGLLSRLMKSPRYNSGGIIAFQEAGSVDEQIRKMTAEQERTADYGEEDKDESEITALRREAAARRTAGPKEEDFDPEAGRRAFKKANPELAAAAEVDTGIAALKRLDELQALRRAEFSKQREEAAQMKPTTLQMLAQAAGRSARGVGNRAGLLSTLAGYTDVASQADAAAIKQEQDLRMKELELQDLRAQAQNKYEEAQRAKAEGRIADYNRNMQEFRKAKNQFDIAAMGSLGREITAAESAQARKKAAAEAAQAKRDVEASRASRPPRTTDQLAGIAIYKPEFLKQGYDDREAEALALDRYLRTKSQAPIASVEQRSLSDAQEMARKDSVIRSPIYRQFLKDANGDTAAAFEKLTEYYRRGGGQKPASATPAPAPAKPAASTGAAAKPKTQAEFNALPSGTRYINPSDGKEYTKN